MFLFYRFEIMLLCWNEDPEKRLAFTEILSTLNTFAGMLTNENDLKIEHTNYCHF